MLSRHGGMEKYGIFVRQKNIKVSNSIMEEKKEMDEGLFKSRSYLSCLNEGLKLPTRHILSLLRFLYPSLIAGAVVMGCLLYTSPTPRDGATSRMPSSA